MPDANLTDPQSIWDLIREWLVLLAVAASAIFAGAIWWLALKRLTTRFIAQVSVSTAGPNHIYLEIKILNRSDQNLTVEGISAKSPWFIPVDEHGAHFGVVKQQKLEQAKPTQLARFSRIVPPDDKLEFTIALGHVGGLASCKKASIRLHILQTFPIIRHKKKVLTAILPAKIRNAQR